MLWRLLRKVEPTIIKLYGKLSQPPIPNLRGERDIEYSWVAANMPEGPGEALDFGCGSSWLGLLATRKGFKVTAIDLEHITWHYEHPSLNFVQGDIFKLNFPPAHFDLVINCSAIEHVGLSGRYGVKESGPDGDMEAMTLLKRILKPPKLMLLTIPVGRDHVFHPLHRVYGEERLPKLISGWDIIKKEFWIKDDFNRWFHVEESVAFNREPVEHCYGLGLFVLRRPIS
jgi:SAM-dependent methyltransferase